MYTTAAPAQGAAPTQAKTFKEARDTLKIQGSVTGEGKKKKKNKGKKGKTSLLTTAQPNTSPMTQ